MLRERTDMFSNSLSYYSRVQLNFLHMKDTHFIYVSWSNPLYLTGWVEQPCRTLQFKGKPIVKLPLVEHVTEYGIYPTYNISLLTIVVIRELLEYKTCLRMQLNLDSQTWKLEKPSGCETLLNLKYREICHQSGESYIISESTLKKYYIIDNYTINLYFNAHHMQIRWLK